MKQFNPNEVKIESETALALLRQGQKPVNQYGSYVGLDVHKDSIAVAIAICRWPTSPLFGWHREHTDGGKKAGWEVVIGR